MTSIPSFSSPTPQQAIPLTRIAPQSLHFGNSSEDPKDTVEIKEQEPPKKSETEVKKGPFIQGGFGSGIKRMFTMSLFRPLGWVEIALDTTAMFFLIPPPFAIKHFLEGFIGANTLFQKSKRINPFATNDKFYAEDYGNRTVVGAIWNGVFKMFGKQPSDFDIAKAKANAAEAANK